MNTDNNNLQGISNKSTSLNSIQQAPGNLQPNGSEQGSLQGVVSITSLLSTPSSNSTVTISGVSSARELVAKDSAASRQLTSTPASSYIIFVVTLVLLAASGFVMMRRLIQDEV